MRRRKKRWFLRAEKKQKLQKKKQKKPTSSPKESTEYKTEWMGKEWLEKDSHLTYDRETLEFKKLRDKNKTLLWKELESN